MLLNKNLYDFILYKVFYARINICLQSKKYEVILNIATFCEWKFISFDSTLRQFGLHQVSFFVKKI